MRRMRQFLAGVFLLIGGGCVNSPLADHPYFQRPENISHVNEIVITPDQPGPEAYAYLFDKVLDVVGGEFDIAFSSRYDGRIESQPRLAPGLEQPWKPGSPNLYERIQAVCQTYRHRCFVLIQPEREGAYRINVTVFKELEDLPKPSRDPSAGAAFRNDPSVERVAEVVDEASASPSWIPKGRDYPLEQKLLHKIEDALLPRK
ncbi:MAG TPA: hypothetical protein VKS79_06415 [Gemmataceae bacterium]|nr:hypothetical protein [Gemmataceae bacterium]